MTGAIRLHDYLEPTARLHAVPVAGDDVTGLVQDHAVREYFGDAFHRIYRRLLDVPRAHEGRREPLVGLVEVATLLVKLGIEPFHTSVGNKKHQHHPYNQPKHHHKHDVENGLQTLLVGEAVELFLLAVPLGGVLGADKALIELVVENLLAERKFALELVNSIGVIHLIVQNEPLSMANGTYLLF